MRRFNDEMVDDKTTRRNNAMLTHGDYERVRQSKDHAMKQQEDEIMKRTFDVSY